MKLFAQTLKKQAEELGELIDPKDPHGVIQDEINQDHANDNRI